MVNNYPSIAGEVLALCASKDSYFPRPSDAVILAWSEDLEYYEINRDDALAAVRKLYRENTDPKFRPSIGLVCRAARAVRQERIDRGDQTALEGAERITLAEWRARHPELSIEVDAAFGKAIPDE